MGLRTIGIALAAAALVASGCGGEEPKRVEGTGGAGGGGGGAGGSGGTVAPRCGNGIVEGAEVCDDGAGNSDEVADACRTDCTAPRCGDGVVDGQEGCDDGNAEDGDGCSAVCEAVPCGNGTLDEGEACDGAELDGKACTDFDFDGGTLGCAPGCVFDTGDCFHVESDCADGTDDDGDGQTDCEDSDCADDVESCPSCGDGVLNQTSEACDGEAFTATCVELGYTGGTPTCAADCTIDPSSCIPAEDCATAGDEDEDGDADCDDSECAGHFECPSCGDGILQRGEACEGQVPEGQSCKDHGFNSGSLQCTACAIDTSACTVVELCDVAGDEDDDGDADCDDSDCDQVAPCPVCGNGALELGESCDDGNGIAGDGCDASCGMEIGSLPPKGASTTVTSSLDGTEPFFSRPQDDCETWPPGDYHFDAVYFTNNETQPLRVTVSGDWGNQDGFLLVSLAPFDPANVLATCVGSNDNAFQDIYYSLVESVVVDPGQTVAFVVTTHDPLGQIPNWSLTILTGGQCGDGARGWDEPCDDGGNVNGDGCDAQCFVEVGWACDDAGCHPTTCGDGVAEGYEECDDGNTVPTDGCSAVCQLEGDTCANPVILGTTHQDAGAGTWTFSGHAGPWTPNYDATCLGTALERDGVVQFTAPAAGDYHVGLQSDTNVVLYVWDGLCDPAATQLLCESGGGFGMGESGTVTLAAGQTIFIVIDEAPFTPDDMAGTFSLQVETRICGDGIVASNEGCDDANVAAGDGCSACAVEPGWACDAGGCHPTSCGDGTAEGQEECDDGNALDGDGCTAGCLLEGDDCALPRALGTLWNAAENAWIWQASTAAMSGDLEGGCAPSAERDAVAAFTAAVDGSYLFDLQTQAFSPVLYVLDAVCAPTATELACTESPSRITADLVAGQTVYVVVDAWGFVEGGSHGDFVLRASRVVCGDGAVAGAESCDDGNAAGGDGCSATCAVEPGHVCPPQGGACHMVACGDGVLDYGEGCDDGNTLSFDGCDGWCMRETPAVAETEPNDDIAGANALAAGDVGTGTALLWDYDTWSFQATLGTTYRIYTTTGYDRTCGTGQDEDTEISLFDSTDSWLASDNDGFHDGSTYCSGMTWTAPATGTYYVKVSGGLTYFNDVPVYYVWID